MADERRTSRKPGRPTGGRPVAGRSAAGRSVRGRSGSAPGRSGADRVRARRERAAALARVAEQRAEEKQRSRLTGRAAILVLVLAVLAVSYASSLRAYLQQRSHIESLEQQIVQKKGEISELEREKERWEDPAYVAQQARARFGYVEPGETPFVVVDEDGTPLSNAELGDPSSVPGLEETTWYDDTWESVKVAGDPPTRAPAPPAKKITGSPDEG